MSDVCTKKSVLFLKMFPRMTPYERDIVRVAGNSSMVWRLKDLDTALRANDVEIFGPPGGPALANFIKKRIHIFNFKKGEVSTKFASIDGLPSSRITNVYLPDNLQRKFDKVHTYYIIIVLI